MLLVRAWHIIIGTIEQARRGTIVCIAIEILYDTTPPHKVANI